MSHVQLAGGEGSDSHKPPSMHLGGAILIVTALVVAEAAPPLAARSRVMDCFFVGLGILVVIFAAAAISGLVAAQIRSNPANVRDSLRGYSRLRKLHTWLWFAVSAVCVLVVQWPQWVVREWHTPLFGLDELLAVIPVVAPMFFSYAAFFEVDRAAAGALGGPASARLASRWSYAWWFLRHEFGLVVVPLLLLILVRDMAAVLGPAGGEGAGPVAGLAVLLLLTGFPVVMKLVWPCTPLADVDLRDAIARECQRDGQRLPQLLEWHTGGRVVNAVVTGTLPRMQCVFLSDALLAHFSHEEVLAVLRHELAHARRHHVLLRVFALAVPLLLCHAAGVPEIAEDAYARIVSLRFAAGEWAVLAAVGAGLVGYASWVFGAFSRMLEMEADLVSCGHECFDPDRGRAASAALYKLGRVYGLDRQSWLHPTLRVRLRILRAASRRGCFAERILRRVRWWKIAMVAGVLSAALLALLRSAESINLGLLL